MNPDHLYIGTHADNMQDRARDGTTAKEEIHGRAVLTADQVRAIRSSSERGSVLARRYGVGHSTISSVIHRVNWKSLD